MKGWLKLHRSLLESSVFKNSKVLHVFMYCLLHASHKAREQLIGSSVVDLQAGQLVTGRKAIAKGTDLSEQSVRTALKSLTKLGMLTIEPTTQYSIVTVNNWLIYQSDNHEATNDQPTANQRLTTNKNVKNVKNGDKDASKYKRSVAEQTESQTKAIHAKLASDSLDGSSLGSNVTAIQS